MRKKISLILFDRYEKQVIILKGKSKEEILEKYYYYLETYDSFKIIKSIKHSNSRHLWIADLLEKHIHNIPEIITGHSKKEVKEIVATIKDLFEEDLHFQIYKLY